MVDPGTDEHEGDGTGVAAPYVLLGQQDRGLFEYHVYCTLGPDEQLEFVAPTGEVVATWPNDSRADDGAVVARGDRFFHARDDLRVRVATRSAPGAGP